MQDNAMSRWLSPLMAFCLSFIIIATLAPIVGIQVERQLDFWLLWLGSFLNSSERDGNGFACLASDTR